MRRAAPRRSNWPETLGFQISAALREPVTYEKRFDAKRKWRFDLALERLKIAVEVDGGGYVNGRHSRGTGIEKDCEKFAHALILGWKVLRVTPKHVQNGDALNWIESLIVLG